jgi:predicted nucleic acid-binding protein
VRAIVSDTTPLNYLVLIEAVELLPRLYQRALIPPAVRDELTRPRAPETVRLWIAQPPSWLEVVTPSFAPDPALSHLDDGETQAIALAMEYQAELLLLDERDATIAARERGLTVTGTLGVLDRDLLDYKRRRDAARHEAITEDVSSPLRRELLMLGNDRNRLAGLQVLKNHEKKIILRPGGDGFDGGTGDVVEAALLAGPDGGQHAGGDGVRSGGFLCARAEVVEADSDPGGAERAVITTLPIDAADHWIGKPLIRSYSGWAALTSSFTVPTADPLKSRL